MYKSYKKEVLKALSGAEGKALELIGEQARTGVVDEITEVGLVDTGYMRNSTDYDNQKDKVVVGVAAEYAVYVNNTKKGKNFFKRGVYNKIDTFQKIAEQIYKEFMK